MNAYKGKKKEEWDLRCTSTLNRTVENKICAHTLHISVSPSNASAPSSEWPKKNLMLYINVLESAELLFCHMMAVQLLDSQEKEKKKNPPTGQ